MLVKCKKEHSFAFEFDVSSIEIEMSAFIARINKLQTWKIKWTVTESKKKIDLIYSSRKNLILQISIDSEINQLKKDRIQGTNDYSAIFGYKKSTLTSLSINLCMFWSKFMFVLESSVYSIY